MNVSIVGLLGAELFVILAGFALAWSIFSWHQRRQRDRSLAELIDLLEKNAAERILHYDQWLKSHQDMDGEQADRVANQWMEVERDFWQAFIIWHLHPDQRTLPDFPHHMQRLLNARLEILAGEIGPPTLPDEGPTATENPELLDIEDASQGVSPESSAEAKEETPLTQTTKEDSGRETMETSAEGQGEEENDDIRIYSDQNGPTPPMTVTDMPAENDDSPEGGDAGREEAPTSIEAKDERG